MELLDDVIEALLAQKPLAPRHFDHSLFGNYPGFRECHFLPDWLLIYRKEKK